MKKTFLLLFIIVPLSLAAFIFVTPDADFSADENRALKVAGNIRTDAISGDFQNDLENYLSDQFPMRAALKSAENTVRTALGANEFGGAYVGNGGRLFQKITDGDIDKAAIIRFAERVESFAKESGVPVYAMPVPSAGAALDGELPYGAPFYDFDGLLHELSAAMPSVKMINLKKSLGASADNYYLTDHHWTFDGVCAAYLEWKSARGEGQNTSGGETITGEVLTLCEDFHGTLYSKALLPQTPFDAIKTLAASGNIKVTADGVEVRFYDLSALDGKDKYNVFQGGNHGIVIIENPDAANKRTLVIIKDSFANSFVPMLVGEFSKIVMLDDRYMLGDALTLTASYAPDEVLVLKEIVN